MLAEKVALAGGGPRAAALGRILVAMDGSPESASAMALAARLALASSAAITALHVCHRSIFSRPREVPAMPLDSFAERFPEEGEESKLALLAVRVLGGRAGVVVDLSAARGKPAHQILAAARSSRADLVVMGTHGKTAHSAERRLGSVARAVFSASPVPTVVVPPRAVRDADALVVESPAAGARPAELLKVLAAIDAGPGSDRVVAEALRIATATRGALRIFSGGPRAFGADPSPFIAQGGEASRRAGVRFSVETSQEDALARLESISRGGEADLLVVGTRARPGPTGDHLGSFTDRLLEAAACPVEVVSIGGRRL